MTNFLLHNEWIKVPDTGVIWIHKLFRLSSTQEHKETGEKKIQDRN